jgi:transposase InsO family protein
VLKVSPSGYYAWLVRPISARVKANQKLLLEIRTIHQESRQAYGSLKTWKTLNARGIFCGKHRVARLRRLNGIEAKRRRRFKVTTNSRSTKALAPNLLNRCFQVGQPNRVWIGDVTFVATRAGWIYLAVLLDLYSRKVIGWSMSERIDKRLVLDALDMALIRRRPDSEVLHHTDRGSIYASDEYREKMARHRLRASMSRKADCYDNAVAESFFSTLKNELVSGSIFQSRERARSEIFSYIEGFYNRRRIHQSLNYRTPEEMEMLVLS